MSNKKNKKITTSSDRTVNILIICTTVLVILLAGLITFTTFNKSDDSNNTENMTVDKTNNDAIDKTEETVDIAQAIADLNITENPVATLTMEDGGIMEIELYPEIAPNTVCNFIELANSGYYDGLIFHRSTKGSMSVIQGGCPEGTGSGGPGYTIKGEFTSNGFENNLSHERGVISMARRAQPLDSAGSQFFIMIEDYPYLNGDYSAFGKVISGMEVADAINAQETDVYDKPLADQIIKSIRVDTKGITYPESEKIR